MQAQAGTIRTIGAIAALATVFAQPPANIAFEVASIRPVQLGGVINGYTVNGPNVTLEAYNLPSLVIEAYALERYQLTGPPQLIRDQFDTYYRIAAKAPGTEPPTRAQVREMLQELLASRFGLRFHHENRPIDVYELRVARNGHKLRESNPETARVSNHRVRGRNQTIEATHVTMQELTREMGVFVDRPVVDKTGLTGAYDIGLEATPYFRLTNNPQLGDITMFDAIQETLGLRLEPAKADVSVIVLDTVEKPSEN